MASVSNTLSVEGVVEVALSAILPMVVLCSTDAAVIMEGEEESKGLLPLRLLMMLFMGTAEFTLKAWVTLTSRASFMATNIFIFAQLGKVQTSSVK